MCPTARASPPSVRSPIRERRRGARACRRDEQSRYRELSARHFPRPNPSCPAKGFAARERLQLRLADNLAKTTNDAKATELFDTTMCEVPL
jgi:hypothetical protein